MILILQPRRDIFRSTILEVESNRHGMACQAGGEYQIEFVIHVRVKQIHLSSYNNNEIISLNNRSHCRTKVESRKFFVNYRSTTTSSSERQFIPREVLWCVQNGQ